MSKVVDQKMRSLCNVYNTSEVSLWQDDASERFIIRFPNVSYHFKLCQLIAFRKKVFDINIVELLSSDTPDVEIIELVHCNKFLILTVKNILEIRSLLEGGFFMLELNSLIHQTLIRPSFSQP